MGSDKDDSTFGSKGVYGRSGKSTAGDVGVIRHGTLVVVVSVVGIVGNMYVSSRFGVVVFVGTSGELLRGEDGGCGRGYAGGKSSTWRVLILLEVL